MNAMNELNAGKQMLTALIPGTPIYLLDASDPRWPMSPELANYLDSLGSNTVAATSSIMDLMCQDYFKYEWNGRGLAIVFKAATSTLTSSQLLGVLLHEAAHHVADGNRPERDDQNEVRAIKRFWNNLPTDQQSHDHRWARALVSLFYRALGCGHDINLRDLAQMRIYGRSSIRHYADSLTGDKHSKPIDSLLRTKSPQAFRNLVNHDARRNGWALPYPPKPTARATSTTKATRPTVNGRRKPRQRRDTTVMMIGGQLVTTYRNGWSIRNSTCRACVKQRGIDWSTRTQSHVTARCPKCGSNEKLELKFDPRKQSRPKVRRPYDHIAHKLIPNLV